jgi:fused signal recognition particle receptor
MFQFLKDKLKQAISKFSKDVDKEADDIEEAPPVVTKPVKKEKPKEPPAKKEVRKEEKKEEPKKQERKEAPKKEKTEKVEKAPEKKPAPQKEELKVEEDKVEEEIPEKELEQEEEALLEEVEKEEGELEQEEKEEVPAAPGHGAGLQGLKESLESYSDDELDSLIDILNMPGDVKYEPREEKVKSLLSKPLVDINFAINQLENAEETEEDKKEEELLEEVEKEEEKLEPEEKEEKEKPGFFKRLFGFGKKKEEEPEEKEEEKAEEEAEEKPEAEAEEPKKAKPGKTEKPEEEKGEGQKTVDDELEEIGKEEEELKKEIEEEDSELGEEEEEKTGFFGKLTRSFTLKKLSDEKFEEIFFELEIALLENNVAVEVIEKIKKDLHERLVDKKLKRSQIEEIVIESLKDSLEQILDIKQVDVLKRISEKRKANKPFVIIFVGINGSGKTTTIAKMARYFMDNRLKTVMVAADTFRAAAIQQLEEHANRLGVKIIKHDYGSDPAAVAFDGIKYAEAKGIDVVLVDTAGRLHSNTNLMDEMKKVIRVADPDMKIFIGESITGNDCIEQAQKFNEAIEIDGIVLSKADVDEKGGAAISVSYVTGKPILFIGTGQTYADLQKFDKKVVLSNLGLE